MNVITAPQFGTRAQVTIVPPFGPGVIVNPDLTPGVVQQRVDWQVTKGVGGGTPNSCAIRIYNLGASVRARAAGIVKRTIDFSSEIAFLDGRLITGADLGGTATASGPNGFGTVVLKARYQGSSTVASLFEGTATQVISRHRQDTWITTIVGGDGVIQNTSAIADKFWSSTVPAVEVITYLVTRVMVTTLATAIPPQLAGYVFLGGFDSTNKYATDILDELTRLTSTEWWWDDGAVFFSSLGAPNPGPPIILSPTGAPGTTRLLSKPRRTQDNQVQAEALMLPELRPKTAVTIQSAELGGAYFATAVTHRGSNRGGTSKTIATLTQIGVVPFL